MDVRIVTSSPTTGSVQYSALSSTMQANFAWESLSRTLEHPIIFREYFDKTLHLKLNDDHVRLVYLLFLFARILLPDQDSLDPNQPSLAAEPNACAIKRCVP